MISFNGNLKDVKLQPEATKILEKMSPEEPIDTESKLGVGMSVDSEAKALWDHDLRSAVSDVIGGLQSLDLAKIGDENQAQIARMSTAAALALRLLDAKQGYWPSTQKASHDAPMVRVDVNKLLHDVELRWQGRVAAKGLTLIFKLEIDDDFHLDFDELDMQRILSNILENAVKFTDHGQITVTARQTPHSIFFSVADQGTGFSPDAASRLFTFGGRPEKSTKPGSGLGLFIVKQIVERMNGRITAKNADVGALVEVEIPLLLDGSPLPHEQGMMLYQRLAGQRVLLAEDNKTNQFVASQMLHALGAEVTIANDGQEAWELLHERAFDICLLDVEMPRKSGLELINDIRSSEASFAQMPLIVLTAYVMREHLQRIQQAGADGIIAKPLTSIEIFGDMIQNYCQNMGYELAPLVLSADSGPVNLQTYNALRDTVGRDVFTDLLDKLVVDLEDVETRFKNAFEENEIMQIRTASHNLVSLAGAVGATDLLEVAQQLNMAAHKDEYGDMITTERKMLMLLADLLTFLKASRQELAGV